MPTCAPEAIAPVINEVMKLRPRSILDVGCGMGKFGMLFREYLEGWGSHRYSPEQFKLTIDAVEGYAPYVQDWHRAIYNRIFVGDVRKLYDELPAYDLAYLGDVLEHVPKEDGKEMLARLQYRWAIISTPAGKTIMHRGKPNAMLDHQCLWTALDFKPYRPVVLHHGKVLIVRLGT